MYLVGADHPNKALAYEVLHRLIAEKERLITDAEVFQEILHRYVSQGRETFVEPCFELLSNLVDEVLPIDFELVSRAKEIYLSGLSTSSRDAIHVAAMERAKIDTVFSFDTGFDQVPGLQRIYH